MDNTTTQSLCNPLPVPVSPQSKKRSKSLVLPSPKSTHRPATTAFVEVGEVDDDMNPHKIAEIANALLVILASVCYLTQIIKGYLHQDQTLSAVMFCVFSAMAFVAMLLILRQNLNCAILTRLLKEVNVVLVLVFVALNVVLDFWVPKSKFVPVYSVMLFMITIGCILLDAISATTRLFSLFVRITISLLILFNTATYFTTISPCPKPQDTRDKFWASTNHTMSWVEAKRLLFVELTILVLSAAFVGSRDQEHSYISFPTAVVVKRHRAVARNFSLTSFLFTSNHLAECITLLISLISFFLYLFSVQLFAAILVLFPILLVLIFILKRNIDKSVLRLVMQQKGVLIMLFAIVSELILTIVDNPTPFHVLGSIAYLLMVLLNVSFDAVRVISRFFRVTAFILIFALIVCDFRVDLSNNSCKNDWLSKHTSSQVTVVQLQRLFGFVVLVMHIRPLFLIIFHNHPDMLYFVTANVKKQLVVEGSDGVYLSYNRETSLSLPITNASTNSATNSATTNSTLAS